MMTTSRFAVRLVALLLVARAAIEIVDAAATGKGQTKAAVAGTTQALADLRLVRITEGTAVIRFGRGALQTVRVGDRIGDTKAEVKEAAAGRLTLEETFTGKDGKPNRALIIIKEGERGGTRYLQRADEAPAIDVKPVPVAPGSSYGSKPAAKKPPQM